MITRLIVGNFKAIRDPVEVDLRPITLLFGPNAAGKSSILHALHYAIEALEERSLDTHHTRLGREHIDLGGFAKMVHNHDRKARILLGFEQAWSDDDQFSGTAPYVGSIYVASSPVANLVSAGIHCHRITWRIGRGRPEMLLPPVRVMECTVDLNEELIAELKFVADPPGEKMFGVEPPPTSTLIAKLSVRHPLLAVFAGTDSLADPTEGPPWKGLRELVAEALGQAVSVDAEWVEVPIEFRRENDGYGGDISNCDALPRPFSRVAVRVRTMVEVMDNKPISGSPLARETLEDLLHVILIEPVRQLHMALMNTIHVGPLRTRPSRESDFIKIPYRPGDNWHDAGCWYDGSAAWMLPLEFIGREDSAGFGGSTVDRCLELTNSFLEKSGLLTNRLLLRIVTQRRFLDNRSLVAAIEKINAGEADTGEYDDGDGWEPLNVPALNDFVSLFGKTKEELDTLSREQLVDLVQKINASASKLSGDPRLVLHDPVRKIDLTPQDVGVGVSQAIPVLMAMFLGFANPFRMIEQPELHLHPKAQVALGDAIIQAWQSTSGLTCLLVETHSEHLLLRILRRIRETAKESNGQTTVNLEYGSMTHLSPEVVSVIYVEPSAEGVSVRRLRIDDQGEFIDRWPQGFFEERAEELFS